MGVFSQNSIGMYLYLRGVEVFQELMVLWTGFFYVEKVVGMLMVGVVLGPLLLHVVF